MADYQDSTNSTQIFTQICLHLRDFALIPQAVSSMHQNSDDTGTSKSLSLEDSELFILQQGKSEGFDSCDRPSNLTQTGFESSIFQPVWPWYLMDDPKKQYGTSSMLL